VPQIVQAMVTETRGDEQRCPHATAHVVVIEIAALAVGEHQRRRCALCAALSKRRLRLGVDGDNALETIAIELAQHRAQAV
jgi:hypothetical protein